jgi:hypothetical protein
MCNPLKPGQKKTVTLGIVPKTTGPVGLGLLCRCNSGGF